MRRRLTKADVEYFFAAGSSQQKYRTTSGKLCGYISSASVTDDNGLKSNEAGRMSGHLLQICITRCARDEEQVVDGYMILYEER